VTTQVVVSLAFLSRYTRNTVIEMIKQDYVRTARAKGLDERTILLRHVLRPGLTSFVTLFGMLLPGLISGSVIVEKIFNIPGMGFLAFQAFQGRDYNVIMILVLMGSFLTLLGVWLTDILLGWSDPRISRRKAMT
jgi:peptide/nickel transport system permease protein